MRVELCFSGSSRRLFGRAIEPALFAMKTATLLVLALLPLRAAAQTPVPLPVLLPSPAQPLRLGTNEVVPCNLVQFTVSLNASARFAVAQAQRNATTAKGGLIVPEGFDSRKPCPLLIVSVPSGGSAIASMRSYTNVALSRGWAVLAADGSITSTMEQDSIAWGWAMLDSVLDYLAKAWPASRQSPVVCAGFSGGAKRSGCTGAAMMKENYRVVGMFMGGCNQDLATFGLRTYHPGEGFKLVPIFLSAGKSDPIASIGQARAVKQSMERSGFKRVRLVEYEGGHRLDQASFKTALDWFWPNSTYQRREAIRQPDDDAKLESDSADSDLLKKSN
jgi:predicted esterase